MKFISVELAYQFTAALLGVLAASSGVAILLSRIYADPLTPSWDVIWVAIGLSVVNFLGLVVGTFLGMPLLDRLEFKGVHTDLPISLKSLLWLVALWILLIVAIGVLQTRMAYWLVGSV